MSGRLTYMVRTPEGLAASGPCDFLVVPTTDGELGVLPDHAALVACVAPGALRITVGAEVRMLSLGGGIVDVRDNEVRLLVASAGKPTS